MIQLALSLLVGAAATLQPINSEIQEDTVINKQIKEVE